MRCCMPYLKAEQPAERIALERRAVRRPAPSGPPPSSAKKWHVRGLWPMVRRKAVFGRYAVL
eukprot:2243603-Prymnesium_polylepis.1